MRTSRVLKQRTRRQVLVTLKSGEVWSGVLYEYDAHAWVLRGVEAVGAGLNRTNLLVDGELIVLAADIAYCQLPD